MAEILLTPAEFRSYFSRISRKISIPTSGIETLPAREVASS